MKVAKWFAFFSLIFLVVVIVWPADGLPSNDNAYHVAQDYIKDKLLDPNSAEFIEGKIKMGKVNDSTWVFTGVVKATNKLGLKSPNEYYIRLRFKGGSHENIESWKVESFNFE